MLLEKKCKNCSKIKLLEDFHNQKGGKLGKHSKCKPCRASLKKSYYHKNKETIKVKNSEYQKDYYQRVEVKESRRAYMNSYRQNIHNKLAHNLRVRLNTALRRGYKTSSAVNSLGCSLKDLKNYLESYFQPGMSWENYGEWHIDHIKPLASFDLQNELEFKKACNYTNLQPLWAAQNFSKSNKELV